MIKRSGFGWRGASSQRVQKARCGDQSMHRPVLGCERRPNAAHGPRRADWSTALAQATGQHGHPLRRELRYSRRRDLRLPRHLRGRQVQIVKGLADQRVQPRAHGRDAQELQEERERHRAPDRVSTDSAGAKFRAAMAAEKPFAMRGRDQRLSCAARGASRIQVHLPVGRRRRRRLARASRPGDQQSRRRPHGCAAASPTCARCRCWSTWTRLRRERLQHRAHGEVADQVGRRRHATRTRWAPSAADTGPERAGVAGRDGRPHQGGGRRENRPGFSW